MKTKDIYIPKKVPRIEVREKLHGHTKIMLRDVRTGKVERIEHDNTFTDGIDGFLKENGIFRSGLSWSGVTGNSRPYFITALGGILLFDTALPTSPMAKYMPAGTTMTANASYGETNADNPTEMGSFNAVESTMGDDSFSLVYDWNTSQGNGTIASVSLTTKNGGYMGYGNASLANKTTRNFFADAGDSGNYYRPPVAIGGTQLFINAKCAKLPYNDRLYICENNSISSGATSVTIKHKSLSVQNFDIFENWKDSLISAFGSTITFTIPALSSNYRLTVAGAAYPSCFLLVPNTNISNGSSLVLYLLDVDDGSTTAITVTNNTGETINAPYVYLCDDTYLVAKVSSSGWMKINYTTSAVVGAATNSSGRVTDMALRGLFTDSLMSVSTDNWVYDPVLNRFLPTNGAIFQGGSRTGQSNHYLKDYDCCCYIGAAGDSTDFYNYMSILAHPLRLMTINNLQTPVTKDASKTMKVTYTVTRSA